ncbi:hypothetical protein ACJX0J_018233, partial [Zea mays]
DAGDTVGGSDLSLLPSLHALDIVSTLLDCHNISLFLIFELTQHGATIHR